MKTNNQIKEIEKRTNGLIQYNINQLLGTRFNFGLNKPELLLLEKKIKNLKQFQKEIKELQGELEERFIPKLVGELFKKRFGDLK